MNIRTLFLKNSALLGICAGLCLSLHICAEEMASEEKTVGRLFSQPNERAKLDELRKKNALRSPQISHKNAAPVAANISTTLPKPITLQGYVKRSDGGKSTVWINNKAVQENSLVNDVKIGRLTQHQEAKNNGIIKNNHSKKTVERLEISIPANGKHVQLKAGQRYEPEYNQIKEVTTIARERQLQLLETPDENALNVE